MNIMFGFSASGSFADNIDVPMQPGRVNDAIPKHETFKKSRRFMFCLIFISTDSLFLYLLWFGLFIVEFIIPVIVQVFLDGPGLRILFKKSLTPFGFEKRIVFIRNRIFSENLNK